MHVPRNNQTNTYINKMYMYVTVFTVRVYVYNYVYIYIYLFPHDSSVCILFGHFPQIYVYLHVLYTGMCNIYKYV